MCLRITMLVRALSDRDENRRKAGKCASRKKAGAIFDGFKRKRLQCLTGRIHQSEMDAGDPEHSVTQ